MAIWKLEIGRESLILGLPYDVTIGINNVLSL
jgi:hypothetical protein